MEPMTELHRQFSSEGAVPLPWSEARAQLEEAEVYWLSTVRPDGRPHVTPVAGVWLDGAFYFCTGASERKAKNLTHNAHCVITSGCNTLSEGLDLVLEGDAVQVSDETKLKPVAEGFTTKYAPPFNFSVSDLAERLVYQVAPAKAFGFGKGEVFSQTRWRFGHAGAET